MILVALLLAAFVINLDTTLVNVALPTLVRELHATTTQLQWVVDAYNLVFAALLLTAGALGPDRTQGHAARGPRGVRPRERRGGLRAAGRADRGPGVMGLGAAMVFPSTLSLISNVFIERGPSALARSGCGARPQASR